MAKVSTSEMKTYLAVKSDDAQYDNMLSDLINFVYGKIDEYCSLDPVNNKYIEYQDFNHEDFSVSAMAKDLTLTKVTLDGDELTIATDLAKVDYNKWELKNEDYKTAERLYVEYTSDKTTAQVKKLVMEIVAYEFKRTPNDSNLLFKQSSMVPQPGGGLLQERYLSSEEFYDYIAREFRRLFYRGL